MLDLLLKPLKDLMMESRVVRFRIILILWCAVVVLKLFTMSFMLWLKRYSQILQMQESTGKSVYLGMLTFCMIYFPNMGFALIECFVLYYCCLCWILKRAFKVYIDLLKNNLEGRRVLSYHSRITKAVSCVDAVNSQQLFWIFSLFLVVFFAQTYILMHETIDINEIIITGWSALLFFVAVMSAASVGESAESLKQYMSENDSKFEDNMFYRMSLKMDASDNQLTVWKMFILKKTYILMHDTVHMTEVILTAWSALLFSVTVVSAASVRESSESLKQYMSVNDLKFEDITFYRMNLKMAASDNQLTVWKMFILKKVTLINVAGALITYAVILL
ncbi:hypothetical protein JTE90_013617 [Oedothorax gibbosus]|uniref:Gustatory receptor n=1 Tax=Oedothorax gibbosus TaxID=931172 RepID=A0AAV6UQ97_9ARAC|nr:hypothetical protein JTE90_013617 [Oedothorax gibbosus]